VYINCRLAFGLQFGIHAERRLLVLKDEVRKVQKYDQAAGQPSA
jgi:hypothetical protein